MYFRFQEMRMVFVFDEDGSLEVLDNKKQARQYEAIDVESGVFVFYDEDGTWLAPKFTKQNRHRRFLWGSILSQGTFELIRNPVLEPTVDTFEIAIKEAVHLAPNKHFKTLDEIASYVALQRRLGKQDGE